jgi:hypothetical protein
MITQTYPLKSVKEVGRIFVEEVTISPTPEYINLIGIYVAYGGKGVKAFTLYEVEKGKEDEGYKEIMQRFTPFFPVQGFEIDMDWVLPVQDALPMIGLEG